MERSLKLAELIIFLQDELAISSAAIAVAVRRHQQLDEPTHLFSKPGNLTFENNLELPMLLWQYGLVSLEQLQQIFDWLESQTQFSLSVNSFPFTYC